MLRKSRTMTISMPPELYDVVTALAKSEHRTQSELMREALRYYSHRSTRRSRLERIEREGAAEREELGLPPARVWTDEELVEMVMRNEPDEDVRREMLRELGIE